MFWWNKKSNSVSSNKKKCYYSPLLHKSSPACCECWGCHMPTWHLEKSSSDIITVRNLSTAWGEAEHPAFILQMRNVALVILYFLGAIWLLPHVSRIQVAFLAEVCEESSCCSSVNVAASGKPITGVAEEGCVWSEVSKWFLLASFRDDQTIHMLLSAASELSTLTELCEYECIDPETPHVAN